MARPGKEWSPRGTEHHSFVPGDVIVPEGGKYPEDALDVIEVVNDQVFKAVRAGGGSVMRFGAPQRMKYRFQKVDPARMPVRWHQAKFGMDMLEHEYPGWTTGHLWNGFATPSFDFETTKKILDEMVKFTKEMNAESVERYEFDPKKDEFVVFETSYPDEQYRVRGEWYTVKPGAPPIKLYDLGSGAWTWQEAGE